jgi:hypothetical protein
MIVAERDSEHTPSHTVELESGETRVNGSRIPDTSQIATSLKSVWLKEWQFDIWPPSVVSEAKERAARNENIKATVRMMMNMVLL